MPIYEYRCTACGATSEYLIGMGKDEAISCKGCGSTKMERILSFASFMGGIPERVPGRTCCGREERCETPPCSDKGTCRRG
ncbi:MAG: zinc ribbon domain-containing protein [Thermodesulfobacteriota bacterium]|nr:zinc ribbon domain-containing protein [Thermodesulfobacteriota bacterium]